MKTNTKITTKITLIKPGLSQVYFQGIHGLSTDNTTTKKVTVLAAVSWI